MQFKSSLILLTLIGVTTASFLDLFKENVDFDVLAESKEDNDAYKSIRSICNENGWAYEEYEVTTEDNYILSLMRIPGRINETNQAKKPAVLLQHGLESDASQWVLNLP